MKRLISLSALLLLAMAWTSVSARWVVGERKAASQIKAGDTVVINYAASAALSDRYLQVADDEHAAMGVMVAPGMGLGAAAVITFEDGPADLRTGAPTFFLKMVGSDKYVGKHNYDWYDIGQGVADTPDDAANFQILSCGEEIPWFKEGDNYTAWSRADDAVWDDLSVGFSLSPSENDFCYLALWNQTAPRAITWKYTSSIQWNVYAVTYEKDLREDLEQLIDTYSTASSDFIGGSNPGFYDAEIIAAYEEVLGRALGICYNQDASDEQILEVYDELQTAYRAMANSLIPVTEGYYYIVCDFEKIALNDMPEKAMYINEDVNQIYWGEFDANDIKFVFHLTPYDEKQWVVQNLKNDLFFGQAQGFCKPFSAGNDNSHPATFNYYAGTGSCYIKTDKWTMCPHANAQGTSTGPDYVWCYNGETVSGGNVPHHEWTWQLRKITDQAVLDKFIDQKAQVDRTAELKKLTQEAADLYDRLFDYVSDFDEGLIKRANGGAGVDPDQDNQISFSTIRRQGIETADLYEYLIDGDSVTYMQGSGSVLLSLDEPQQYITFTYKTRGGNESQCTWGLQERPKIVNIYAANSLEGDSVYGEPVILGVDLSDMKPHSFNFGRPVNRLAYEVVSNFTGNSYFTFSEFQLYKASIDESTSQYYTTEGLKEKADLLVSVNEAKKTIVSQNTATQADIDELRASIDAVKPFYADTAALSLLLAECDQLVDRSEVGEELGQLSDITLLENLLNAIAEARRNAFTSPLSVSAVNEAVSKVTAARDAVIANTKTFELDKWYFISNLDTERNGETGTEDAYCQNNVIYLKDKYSGSSVTKWGLYDQISQNFEGNNNPKAMWRFVPVEGTSYFAIQNMYSGYYLGDCAGADINLPVSQEPVPYEVTYYGNSKFLLYPRTNNNKDNLALFAEGWENDVVCHTANANSASAWTFIEIDPQEQEAISISDFGFNLIDVMAVPYNVESLAEYNSDVKAYAIKKMTQEENEDGVLVTTVELYEKDSFEAGEPFLVALGDWQNEDSAIEPYDLLIPFPTEIVDHSVSMVKNGIVGGLHTITFDHTTGVSDGKKFYAMKAGGGFDSQTGVIDAMTYKGEVAGQETAAVLIIEGLPQIPSATTPGDVDGDGKVNTADVVAIYNIILGATTAGFDGDVDGDGKTNTADVVAVYNIILNGGSSSSAFKAQARKFINLK